MIDGVSGLESKICHRLGLRASNPMSRWEKVGRWVGYDRWDLVDRCERQGQSSPSCSQSDEVVEMQSTLEAECVSLVARRSGAQGPREERLKPLRKGFRLQI